MRFPFPNKSPRLAIALLLLVAAASPTPATELLAPPATRAKAIIPGPGSAGAILPNPAAVRLPLTMPEGAARVYWDIPFATSLPTETSILAVRFSMPSVPPHVRAFALHLKSGGGWYAWPDPIPPQTAATLRLPLASFRPESGPGKLSAVSALRISAWRDTAFSGKSPGDSWIDISSVEALSTPVAIVRSTEATAPGETAFAAKMAERCLKTFQRAGIDAAFADDSFSGLTGVRLLVLPYSPALSDAAATKLDAFVAKGGRLVVFYSGSAPLARRFGIQPPVWGKGPGDRGYSAMAPVRGDKPAKGADIVPHRTASVYLPKPAPKSRATVRAFWLDTRGKTTGDPACVVSPAGAWFAHVPSLPTPAAAALLRDLLPSVAPGIPLPPSPPRAAPAKLLAAANPSREIRGAWFPSPVPCHPKGWNGLFADLADTRLFNTAFIRLQASGTACYPSGGVLPERLPEAGSPRVEEIVAAGNRHDIEVHAWVECWSASAAAPSELRRLRAAGRLMENAKGKTLDWRCPDCQENRDELQAAILDLARRGVHVELDFIRYPGTDACFCAKTRKAFETAIGKKVPNWPADVLKDGTLRTRFLAFRAQSLTSWVSDVRDAMRKQAPGIRLSAAVYSNPASGTTVGQDWPAWVRGNLVDFVSPMVYVEDAGAFASYLQRCAGALDDPAGTLVPGIGVTADESQLDAAAVAAQINVCRAQRLRGFAFFACDASLPAILRELAR